MINVQIALNDSDLSENQEKGLNDLGILLEDWNMIVLIEAKGNEEQFHIDTSDKNHPKIYANNYFLDRIINGYNQGSWHKGVIDNIEYFIGIIEH